LIIHLEINIVNLSSDLCHQPWLPGCAGFISGSSDRACATRGLVFHANDHSCDVCVSAVQNETLSDVLFSTAVARRKA
jgi:hypothetical protein